MITITMMKTYKDNISNLHLIGAWEIIQVSNRAYRNREVRSIFHYCDAKEISFYYFCDTKLCTKHEKTHVNSIYIVGIMFVR